jgi:hypothetical protein
MRNSSGTHPRYSYADIAKLKRGGKKEIIKLLISRGLLPKQNVKRLLEKIRRLANQQQQLAEKIEFLNREFLAPIHSYKPATEILRQARSLSEI